MPEGLHGSTPMIGQPHSCNHVDQTVVDLLFDPMKRTHGFAGNCKRRHRDGHV
jgi:hypothetical protein